MKRIACICFLLLNTLYVKAYDNVNADSIKQVLSRMPVQEYGEHEVKLIFSLANMYTKKEVDSSIKYFRLGMFLAKQKNLSSLEGSFCINFGILKRQINERDSAIILFNRALILGESISDKLVTGAALRELGSNCIESYQLEKAREYYAKALKLFKEADARPEMAMTYNQLGNSYCMENNITEGLKNYQMVLSIADGTPPSYRLNSITATTLSNVGLLFYQIGQIDFSVKYFNRALIMANKIEDRRSVTFITSMMAIAYLEKMDSINGIKWARRSIIMDDYFKQSRNKTYTYQALANYYEKRNQFEEAKKWFEKTLVLATATSALDLVADAHSGIGSYYTLSLNANYQEAEKYLKMAEQEAVATGEKFSVARVYNCMSKLYKCKKDFAKAFDYQEKYTLLNDSITGEKKAQALSSLQIYYETEKKELEISRLSIQNKLELERRNAGIGIGIVLLISIAVGSLYVSNRKTLRLKQLHTGQLLSTQESERQRIAKELHDSVGQNILFIRNQLVKQKNEELLGSVDQTLEEVRSISKDLYPNQLEKYGLAAAVDALAEKLKQSTGIFMSSNLDELPIELSPEHKISFYRIIQECVNNTVKHANASVVRVTATLKDKALELVVHDNGQGFDIEVLSEKAHRSFGMLNMEQRVKLLQGKFMIESNRDGSGTRSVFLIPV